MIKAKNRSFIISCFPVSGGFDLKEVHEVQEMILEDQGWVAGRKKLVYTLEQARALIPKDGYTREEPGSGQPQYVVEFWG